MKMSRRFQVFAAIVAVCACNQIANAQYQHMHWIPGPPRTPKVPPAHGLYGVSQAFVHSSWSNDPPTNTWTNNSDGSELWPCFSGVDCPTIGNPSISLPNWGLVTGAPSFTWSLAECNGTTNGTTVPYTLGETWNWTEINGNYVPCGQINSFYQDFTGDTTDEVLWRAVVPQGRNVIADTGIEDWGPNPWGLPGPAAYSSLGRTSTSALWATRLARTTVTVCPTTITPLLGRPRRIRSLPQEDHTCVDPVAGLATILVTTEIATPKWTCSSGTCTVTYKRVYALNQQWNIDLD